MFSVSRYGKCAYPRTSCAADASLCQKGQVCAKKVFLSLTRYVCMTLSCKSDGDCDKAKGEVCNVISKWFRVGTCGAKKVADQTTVAGAPPLSPCSPKAVTYHAQSH